MRAHRAKSSAPSSAAGAPRRSATRARTSPSATSTSCSARGIHLNLDAISQIERYGRRAPGSAIGIRIDPGAGAGYNEHLEYAGDRPTKFGIGLERLDDAIAAAARHQLRVDTVHFHAGSGWLADGLGAFERALAPAVTAVERLRAAGHAITEVNVGGGLGAPARQDEQAVDLDAYAAVLARHLGPLGVTIACEPGDQLTKDGAILLGEVVTVERRRGVTFVGLDIGWNVNCSYFIYRFAQELVVCRAAGAERTEVVTIAGHINEAGDVFAEDYSMPPVEEGDMVALLNAGGYLQAMSSTHCLRPMGEASSSTADRRLRMAHSRPVRWHDDDDSVYRVAPRSELSSRSRRPDWSRRHRSVDHESARLPATPMSLGSFLCR